MEWKDGKGEREERRMEGKDGKDRNDGRGEAERKQRATEVAEDQSSREGLSRLAAITPLPTL